MRRRAKAPVIWGREAVWYTLHTIFAVLVLAVVVIGFWVAHTDPDATNPKMLATLLAFLVPMVVGFAVAKFRQDRTARYIWISAVLLFSIVCVWVLDLPHGERPLRALPGDGKALPHLLRHQPRLRSDGWRRAAGRHLDAALDDWLRHRGALRTRQLAANFHSGLVLDQVVDVVQQ